jgi:peptidoglycan pentaglycine glycine transferase (the first glycine)
MIVDSSTWDQFIQTHPNAHVLQSGRWGDLKSMFGWKCVRIISDDCGAQVLFKKLPLGFTIGYLPKGPVGVNASLLSELDQICMENKALFLKIEPFEWKPASDFFENDPKWIRASPIQPRRTVMISLSGSETELLNGMKQKTRYNIRLAQKKDVSVRESTDIDTFFQMAEVTGRRDGFGIHSKSYYQRVMESFGREGKAILLLSYYQEKPLAGIIVFIQGQNAWYMYGASTGEESNRMPTYLLQWEAMRLAKAKGCNTYDLWGIPDCEEAQLEDEFQQKHSHDGLWGVYRFKRGFGGEVVRSVGAWDRVYRPLAYLLYQLVLKLRSQGAD